MKIDNLIVKEEKEVRRLKIVELGLENGLNLGNDDKKFEDDYLRGMQSDSDDDDDDNLLQRKGEVLGDLILSDDEDYQVAVVNRKKSQIADRKKKSLGLRSDDQDQDGENIAHFYQDDAKIIRDRALKKKNKIIQGSHQAINNDQQEKKKQDIVYDIQKRMFIIKQVIDSSVGIAKNMLSSKDKQMKEEFDEKATITSKTNLQALQNRLSNLVLKKSSSEKFKADNDDNADDAQDTKEKQFERKLHPSMNKFRFEKKSAKAGHHLVETGSKFKSKFGKSDELKHGHMEPYAYIRLNPAMLNKRNQKVSVKSFDSVVGGGNKKQLKGLKIRK